MNKGPAPHIIDKKGSNAALVFWILCIIGCYVCVYALLHNHFYDALPIVGLIIFSGLFLFFAFATRWKERTVFRQNELFYLHTAKMFKKRSWTWPYADVVVGYNSYQNTSTTGKVTIRTTRYSIYVAHRQTGSKMILNDTGELISANGLVKFYEDIIRQRTSVTGKKAGTPGRPV